MIFKTSNLFYLIFLSIQTSTNIHASSNHIERVNASKVNTIEILLSDLAQYEITKPDIEHSHLIIADKQHTMLTFTEQSPFLNQYSKIVNIIRASKLPDETIRCLLRQAYDIRCCVAEQIIAKK